MAAYISLPTYLNTIDARYRLVGQKCRACGHIRFPPKPACGQCGATDFQGVQLSGQGEVHTFTIIASGAAPTEFDDLQNMTGEFAVALVKLEEGPVVVGQMTDCDPHQVEVGMKVVAVIRRLYEQEGVIRYGYKFKPVR
ncbi:MAG TPA: Zn-ribbon domain-containing OB-fold protein [Dehalococcoidia bacterium]|nr:Zn-ribbon domain-containing OB-fold protein [Dehalococcoidia bacterium]